MTRTAKILLVASAALLGTVLGFVAGVAYQAKSIPIGFSLLAGRILVAESRNLERVYGSANRDLQVHALEHFGQMLELTRSEVGPLVGDDSFFLDMAVTYGRLGLLHRANGDMQKAKQSLDKAVEYLSVRNGRQASEDEIVQYVLKLDRGLAR